MSLDQLRTYYGASEKRVLLTGVGHGRFMREDKKVQKKMGWLFLRYLLGF